MRKILLYLSIFTLFIPLLISGEFFFPYVFFKGIVFRLIVIFGLSSLLIYFWQSKLHKLAKNWLIISAFSFLLILPLTSIFSVEISDSLWGGFERMEGAFYYLFLLGFLFILLQIFNQDKHWEKVFLFITASSLLVDLLAIFQKLGFNFWLIKYDGRIGGTLGNAAYLASFALLSLIFLLFFFYKYKKYRWLSGVAIGLNLLTIFISATRGTLLALFLSLFLALIFLLFKKNLLSSKIKMYVSGALLLMVIFFGSIFIFKDTSLIQNIEPLQRLSSISLEDATSVSRLVTWQYAWQGFLERPIFGWGLENFDLVFNQYFDGRVSENWFDRAHNNYLDILTTGGIVSLLAYLIFVYFVFRSIYLLHKNYKIDYFIWLIFTFGWLAYLIQNIFIFDSINSLILVLFFVALLHHLSNAEYNEVFWSIDNKIFKLIALFVLTSFLIFLIIFCVILPIKINRTFFQALQTSDINNFQQHTNQALAYPFFSLFNKEIFIFASEQVRSQVASQDQLNLPWIISGLEDFVHKDVKAYLDLSYFYNLQATLTKDTNLARKNIESLLALLPDNPNRYMIFGQLGKSYIFLMEKDNAEKYLKQAYDLKPDDQRAWDLMTMYIYFDDQYTLRYYTNILLDNTRNLSQFSIDNLLIYFQKIRDFESLEKVLLKLADEQPDNASIFYNLTLAKFQLGKIDEAAAYAQKTIDLKPDMQASLEKVFGITN